MKRSNAMRFEKLAWAMVMLALCILWLGLSPERADAAQTVHLKLEIDGSVIEGESTISSMEREGTIECSSFGENGYTPIDAATGLPSGRRQHRPITITKRIDKSSPLLWKAWTNNEPVSKAEFMFFRPAAGGSGAEEKFLTIMLEGGTIASMSVVSMDAIAAGEDAPPVMDSVTFTFQTITWTYENNGATHTDTWAGEL
jgi:type VI secretion system secreted protein Hcp